MFDTTRDKNLKSYPWPFPTGSNQPKYGCDRCALPTEYRCDECRKALEITIETDSMPVKLNVSSGEDAWR